MIKKIIPIIITVLLLINVSSTAFATNSPSHEQGKFNEISNSIKDLDTKISEYDNEIYNLQLKVSKNEESIRSIETEINNTEIKIQTLNEEIKANEEILSYRLREVYKDGSYSGVSILIYIFQSESFGDLFSRLNSAETLISLDNKLISETNKKVEDLNTTIATLNTSKIAIDELNSDTKLSLKSVEDKQSEIKNSKAQLSLERDAISAQIKENEENLVSHQISIIYSSNPTLAQLKDAKITLEGLLPQISTSSVSTKVKNAITEANRLIVLLNQSVTKPDNNDDDDSNDINFKATYSMEASAYSGHGITAMGTVPVRNPNGLSTVAVDPTVIPLGSKVFIPNYGYAMAADTGSAIKGMKIDLYMNSREECYSFGRRTITVHLVALPGEW